MPSRYFFLGFKIYPDVKKLLRSHRTILSYFVLKFPQFQPRKRNCFLYPYSKVINLTNYQLKISIKNSRILWVMLCFNTAKAEPLSCMTSSIWNEKIKMVVLSILNIFAHAHSIYMHEICGNIFGSVNVRINSPCVNLLPTIFSRNCLVKY